MPGNIMGPKDPVGEKYLTTIFDGVKTQLKVADEGTRSLLSSLIKNIKALLLHMSLITDVNITKEEVE